MYWSKYNRIYKINKDTYVIYNYAWNKSIFLVSALKKIVEAYIPSIDKLYLVHPSLFQALVQTNMISENKHEENVIKRNIQQLLSSEKTLRLTINPTLDCNLRCWYCYEAHNHNNYMDDTVKNKIYQFVRYKLNKNVEKVRLAFLGGEPLMSANTIAIPIAQEVVSMCKEKRKVVSLQFTTNGTLLDTCIIKKIAELHVSTSFQIAFDGDRKLHNHTKKWGDISTYDVVLENINNILQHHMSVNIRCNYTSNNIQSFYSLLDDVAKLKNKDFSLLQISLQRVWQEPATEQLLRQAKMLEAYIRTLGFKGGMGDSICARNYCYADYDNSFVINYNGDVFKCTARDFNHSHRIASLYDDDNSEIEKLSRTSEIRFQKVCDECSLFPICTICSQVHKEMSTDICPKKISDADKEQQIKRYFNENFSKYIDTRK